MRTAISKSLVHQVDRPVEQSERDEHLGKSIEKFGDDRQHMQPSEQDRRSQAQLAARRRALARSRPLDLLEVGEHAPGAAQKPLPRLGRADRTRGAGEQPNAETQLQFRDRPGDRGGRAAQPPRGLRKAAAVGHLDEHGNAISPVHTVAYNEIINCEKG